MKKFWSILLLVGLALSLFTGCSRARSRTAPEGDEPGQEGKLSVYASFYTMYDFASKIGGDKVHLVNMVPAGTEPHDWEPTACRYRRSGGSRCVYL